MRVRCNCVQLQRPCCCKASTTNQAFKPATRRRTVTESQPKSDVNVLRRRDCLVLTSGLVLPELLAKSADAQDANPVSNAFSKYIRKKKLAPIESYVPGVLEARQQLQQAGTVMGSDVENARQLLREGAFQGLRDNVRALGEYAVINGQAQPDSQLANGFFKALESYDLVLFTTLRSGDPLPEDKAKETLQTVISALDNLVATVPPDVLTAAQNLVDELQARRRRKLPAATDADVETTLELLS